MRDITHRKRAEERLQASNRHLLLLNRIIGTSVAAHSTEELLEKALAQTLDLLVTTVALSTVLMPAGGAG